MGTPEFPDLGRHCFVADCKQLDFLPFTCDVCHQVFCLEHRSYSKHECANATDKDVTVLVCPLCAKSVRLIPNEDPNVTWARHVETNCDPNNYDRVHRKPRCPVRGCREILTTINKMVCKDCKQEVCLKHRFGADHNCPGGRTASKDKPWYSGSVMESIWQGPSSRNAGKPPSSSVDPGAGWGPAIRSSAEMGVNKLGLFTSSMRNAIGGAWSNGQSSAVGMKASGDEVCPQCGLHFSCISLLIQHVETSHGKSKPASLNDVVDLCPKCGRGFLDPVSLVNHVERDHNGTSRKR